MPKNNTRNSIHAQRLKAIRPFVTFNYDLRAELTASQKRKIKTYYDEIDALTARPYQLYRSKSKTRLNKVQDFAQHEKRLPALKVAFVPTNGIDKAKIRFNKAGDVVASTKHITTRVLSIDTRALIKDPIEHITNLIKKAPKAKRFTALAGRYEIPVSQSRATIARFIGNLTAKYDNSGANNYHGNWLHGLAAHTFSEQADYSEYMKEKQKAKRKVQADKKNKKRRNSYAAAKGRK